MVWMVLLAGMLPGVDRARRRRVRQGVAEAPCGTRRPSLCLYAGGHDDHARLGEEKKRIDPSACKGSTWTLDRNAREAKERLDQKLRSQREFVGNRRPSTRTSTRTKQVRVTGSDSDGIDSHSAAEEAEAPTTMTCALQREVLTEKGGGAARRHRFIWSRLGRRRPRAAECAACLEELRAADVPCAHRFHWACVVPWVKDQGRLARAAPSAARKSTSSSPLLADDPDRLTRR